MKPYVQTHPLDYESAKARPNAFLNTVRRLARAVSFFFAGVGVLLIGVAVVLEKNPLSSTHADLLNWMDIVKTILLDIFIVLFSVACIVLFRPHGKQNDKKRKV